METAAVTLAPVKCGLRGVKCHKLRIFLALGVSSFPPFSLFKKKKSLLASLRGGDLAASCLRHPEHFHRSGRSLNERARFSGPLHYTRACGPSRAYCRGADLTLLIE